MQKIEFHSCNMGHLWRNIHLDAGISNDWQNFMSWFSLALDSILKTHIPTIGRIDALVEYHYDSHFAPFKFALELALILWNVLFVFLSLTKIDHLIRIRTLLLLTYKLKKLNQVIRKCCYPIITWKLRLNQNKKIRKWNSILFFNKKQKCFNFLWFFMNNCEYSFN